MPRAKSKHAVWVAYMKGQPVRDEELEIIRDDLTDTIRVLTELGESSNGIFMQGLKREERRVLDLIAGRIRK